EVTDALELYDRPVSMVVDYGEAQDSSCRNQPKPRLTFARRSRGSVAINWSRSSLFTVASCDAFATQSRARRVARLGRSVLPGARSSALLPVSTQTTTVAILLTFTSS